MPECPDCGMKLHEENTATCDHCGRAFCNDCITRQEDGTEVCWECKEPEMCEHWHSKLRGDLCCAPNERVFCPCDGVKEDCPDGVGK